MTVQERADKLYRHKDTSDARVSLFMQEFGSDELITALRHCNLYNYALDEGYIESTPNDNALRKDVFKMCDKYYPDLSRDKAIDDYGYEIFTDISNGKTRVFNRLCYMHLNGLLSEEAAI